MEKIVAAGSGQALAFAVTYVAILVLLGVALASRVIGSRRAQKIGLGDGDDSALRRRIRAHGNFSEYAPLIGLVLLALPLVGAREWLVHLIGLTAVTGRILHAIGLTKTGGVSFGRMVGMLMTLAALVAGAIAVLILAWR
jgi:uncharacterized membrane protein YecN with MAPEG domain